MIKVSELNIKIKNIKEDHHREIKDFVKDILRDEVHLYDLEQNILAAAKKMATECEVFPPEMPMDLMNYEIGYQSELMTFYRDTYAKELKEVLGEYGYFVNLEYDRVAISWR